MKIKINDTEIELKATMRAMIIYEKIADKPFNPVSITDLILYFYAIILASYPSFEMTFDKFLTYLDDNPQLFKQFTDFINSENEKQNQLNNKSDEIKKKTAKK